VLAPGQRPPAEVTRDLFLVWRMPRLGMNNPQRMSNPVWSWLARQRALNAYIANLHFGGPSSMGATDRLSQRHAPHFAHTALPDRSPYVARKIAG